MAEQLKNNSWLPVQKVQSWLWEETEPFKKAVARARALIEKDGVDFDGVIILKQEDFCPDLWKKFEVAALQNTCIETSLKEKIRSNLYDRRFDDGYIIKKVFAEGEGFLYFIKKNKEKRPITRKNSQFDALIKRIRSDLSAAPEHVRNVAFAEISSVIDKAASPEASSWAERVQPAKPTADVRLPEVPPELWEGSKEQRRAAAGEMKLDAAIFAFTKRCYADFIKSDGTGMSAPDIPDTILREEWMKLRKRFRERGEELPDDCQVPAQPERNMALINKINSGELDVPRNPKFYLVLKQAARRKGLALEPASAQEI